MELAPLIGKHYDGTVIVLDRPSRFDYSNGYLLSQPARSFTLHALGKNLSQVIVCLPDHLSRVGGKKRILFCGPRNAQQYAQSHLDKVRGYVYQQAGLRHMFTYHPADAMDHGPVSYDDVEFDDEVDDFGATEKDGGSTRWSNFRQWFLLDAKKLMAPEVKQPLPFLRLFPGEKALIEWIRRPRKYLYMDIENNPTDRTLWCIGVADDVDETVISIPIYRWDRRAIYNLPRVMMELCRAMHRCIPVAHNANYDFAFLFMEYKFPISFKIHDTMCMHHRAYPELEKSLGHAGSLWCNEPYHKDTGGTWNPKNQDQYNKLLAYNARDVVLTKGCHEAMLAAGPKESMERVNKAAGHYLKMGLTGRQVNLLTVRRQRILLTARLAQFNRVLNILVGYHFNAGSSKQLINYLYFQMKYPVMGKTDSGNPATDAKSLYALLVKHDNPALTVILKIKKDQKALDMLSFGFYERPY